MAHIEFLDETIRDGQQSLWGMRMQAGMALPVTPILDRTGFKTIDLVGSSMFEVLIKKCRENPWEGLDLLVASMPNTPIRGGMRSNAAVSFGTTPDELMDAWMRQLNRHGVRSYWIYDVLFNIDKMHRLAKVAKEFGSEVAGTLLYTQSPVHTDEYYADVVRRLAESADVDTILLYDTAGTLDKERLSTLVPAILKNCGGRPIEFHSNNLLGMSAKAYLDAIELGISVIHTASRPMANGPSVPSTEIMVRNLELRGHTHNLDPDCFPAVAEHFEAVGKAAGFLVNQYSEYDILSIEHQIPGGMVGTLKAQLEQYGMTERLDEVFVETGKVRRELGYPMMATPFSQLVGIQAVLNVIKGKRYEVVPDEVVQYVCGFYGEPVGEIDANVLDKIMASPRAAAIANEKPEQPSLQELRKRYGSTDDDELILKALVPEEDLKAMRAAGPVKTVYPLLSSPELGQVEKLLAMSTLTELTMRGEDLNISLSRG